jgi:hypothetical protein
MPTMDSTAKAAVAADFAPAWFIWLDISGDPLRVTTLGKNVTFASTGDVDLDGNTFLAFDGRAIDVGDVTNSENGSDTLAVTLSGIVTIDTTLINDIGNVALWQGRDCRIWCAVYDAAGVTQQGAIVPIYTGKMSSVKLLPSPKTQTIQLSVENYLAAFNQASNRSYQNQKDYDSADTSAQATLAAANAARHAGGAASSGTVPGASGGWGGGFADGGDGGDGRYRKVY